MPRTISVTKYWAPGKTPSSRHTRIVDVARQVQLPMYLTQSRRQVPMLIITMPDSTQWSVTWFEDQKKFRIFSDYRSGRPAEGKPDMQRRWDYHDHLLAATFINIAAVEMRDGVFDYEYARKPR